MPKHRAAGRTKAPLVTLGTAAVLFLLVGGFVALWPSGPPPSAASESIRRSEPVPDAVQRVPGLRRLVVYGHSMPFGGGASDVSLGYAQVASELTGLKLVNHAEGGTNAASAASTMAASPAAGRRDAVVIHTGMNDIFRRGDDAASLGREAVQRLLAGAAGAGRRILVLECQPASWFDTPPQQDLQSAYDSWNVMLREEATAAGDVDVLDTCERWDPLQFTDPPKYHPNDEGHALIAGEINAVLRSS